MGLPLRNPLVASASPFSYTLDGLRRLADSGVAAIVMFSLFEEQLHEQALRTVRLLDEPAESFPEALGYFPAAAAEDPGPRHYLNLLERAAGEVAVPVIASLNGVTAEGWTGYARAMQNADAAIELNIYYLPSDPVSRGGRWSSDTSTCCRGQGGGVRPVRREVEPVFQFPGRMACRSTTRAPTPDVVMTASALLRHGPPYAAELLEGLVAWMERKGFQSLGEVRGMLAVPTAADGTAYERSGYVSALRAANAGPYEPW